VLPLVVRVKKPSGNEQMTAFADSPIRIGRSPLNQLVLAEDYVSRIEAVVRFDSKEVSYFNVGRTNTPLIDGTPIEPGSEAQLKNNSKVVLGGLELSFSREVVAEDKVVRRTRRRAATAEPTPDLSKTIVFQGTATSQLLSKPARAPAPEVQQARAPQRQPVKSDQLQPVPPSAAVETAPEPSVAVRPTEPAPEPSVAAKSDGPPAPSGAASHDRSALSQADLTASTQATHTTGAGAPAADTAPMADQRERAHAAYRSAWWILLQQLERVLETTAPEERAPVAERLQKTFPQIVREPDFRALLKRLELRPRKPGDPELEQWLRSLGKGLFPRGVRLETGMTVDRLGKLLQMFSQVFVEIQAAQSDARREMSLPDTGPRSLLASEDPNVVLAYLLNPNVDGDERMAELEQSVTKLALHEAALFGAVKDAAQALLESLSPEKIEAELKESDDADAGMLSRVFANKQDARDAQLWRRYRAMHQDLMDGKRYQRRFVGREFARIYMRAMEQLDADS